VQHLSNVQRETADFPGVSATSTNVYANVVLCTHSCKRRVNVYSYSLDPLYAYSRLLAGILQYEYIYSRDNLQSRFIVSYHEVIEKGN